MCRNLIEICMNFSVVPDYQVGGNPIVAPSIWRALLPFVAKTYIYDKYLNGYPLLYVVYDICSDMVYMFICICRSMYDIILHSDFCVWDMKTGAIEVDTVHGAKTPLFALSVKQTRD